MPDASIPPRDDLTFERVFREHAAFAGRVLRRFGVQPRDLADAAQDVFLVVHRRLPELEQPAALRTWLYRICARVAADYRKRAHRRYERFDQGEADAPVADGQESDARHAQLVAQLERTLDALGDEQRQVFVLFELEELRMIEVAELLGCPLKTAFSRLYAARREVRAELRRAGFACVPWAVWSAAPWKARAAAELQAALQALGATASAGGASGAGAVTVAIAPLATATPQLLYAGAAAAGWSYASAVASATGLLTVLMLGMAPLVPTSLVPTPLVPTEGARLAEARATTERARADVRRSPYRIAPRSTSLPARVLTPAHPIRAAERRARSSRTTSDPTRPTPAASAAVAPSAVPPAPQHDWIRAPSPAPVALARPPAPSGARSAGLDDEVLAATSVEPLMRLAPAAGAARASWALVPAGRASSARASSARAALSARRSDR